MTKNVVSLKDYRAHKSAEEFLKQLRKGDYTNFWNNRFDTLDRYLAEESADRKEGFVLPSPFSAFPDGSFDFSGPTHQEQERSSEPVSSPKPNGAE